VPSGAAEIEHIDFNGGVHIPHDAARCRNGTAAEIPQKLNLVQFLRQFAAQLCGKLPHNCAAPDGKLRQPSKLTNEDC